jgi:FKBP-type peptidyl-prolyl cis-trans isomerase
MPRYVFPMFLVLAFLLTVPMFVFDTSVTAQDAAATGAKPKNLGSYLVGYDLGSNLAAKGFTSAELTAEDFIAGLNDALAGVAPRLSKEEIQATSEALNKTLSERASKAVADNLVKSETFLAENKKKDGVQTTETGLQYSVIKSGTGATPKANSTVKVHYEGTLINGSVFDSSVVRGEPLSIAVNGVIPGWTEALQRMKVGDKWKLFIPPGLAYGAEGRPGIPPNEALIFEVELLEVK